MRFSNRIRRQAFTLIELLAAMIAASVLLAALAGTILVSTHLLENPATDQQPARNREIADRIASDLRFANSINETSFGFSVSKPNITTNTVQTTTYASAANGLTRQMDSTEPYVLDEQSPSQTFSVDRNIAPNNSATSKKTRVRSSHTVTTNGFTDSITVDYPPGCADGDLVVMAVSARSTDSISFNPSTWNLLYFLGNDNLTLAVAYRTYDTTQNASTQINFTDGAALAAVAIVAIDNVSISSPTNWALSDRGYAWSFLPITHPSPLEPNTGTLPHHLHLQIFAADGDPWSFFGETLGLASYRDVVQATNGSNSIGIVARDGTPTTLSSSRRAWQRTSGRWLQAGLRLGADQ